MRSIIQGLALTLALIAHPCRAAAHHHLHPRFVNATSINPDDTDVSASSSIISSSRPPPTTTTHPASIPVCSVLTTPGANCNSSYVATSNPTYFSSVVPIYNPIVPTNFATLPLQAPGTSNLHAAVPLEQNASANTDAFNPLTYAVATAKLISPETSIGAGETIYRTSPTHAESSGSWKTLISNIIHITETVTVTRVSHNPSPTWNPVNMRQITYAVTTVHQAHASQTGFDGVDQSTLSLVPLLKTVKSQFSEDLAPAPSEYTVTVTDFYTPTMTLTLIRVSQSNNAMAPSAPRHSVISTHANTAKYASTDRNSLAYGPFNTPSAPEAKDRPASVGVDIPNFISGTHSFQEFCGVRTVSVTTVIRRTITVTAQPSSTNPSV